MRKNIFEYFDDKGVSAIIITLLMVVLLGIAALAVDVGYKYVTQNESQNASDAAALAGARQMGENYGTPNVDLTLNVTSVAQNIGGTNRIDAKNLASDNMVIQMGKWNPANATLITPSNAPDTVCVEVKREQGLSNGPINTFLAPIIGVNNYKMYTKSCAGLTGPCTGKPTIPLGISKDWFNNHICNSPDTIELNATTSSCAGWTNLSTDKFKQADPQCMMDCTVCSDSAICPAGSTDIRCIEACSSCSGQTCKKSPTTTPELDVTDEAEFGGGTITDIYRALQRLWSLKCTLVDGVCKWETYVIVYDASCGNPVDQYEIKAFAHLVITNVIATASTKGVFGTVACRSTDEPGGCFNAGTVNPYPHLVK